MKAIILAAGRGSRMNERTKDSPKCMIEIGSETLLSRCIRNLKLAGFSLNNIGIITGYKKEKIQIDQISYFHNENWENSNMFTSLTMAEQWLNRETCIIIYSDIIFHYSDVQKLLKSDADIAVTYYEKFWELWKKRFENPFDDLESFKIFDDKLIEIGSRANSMEDLQGQYMGLIRFTPAGWKNINNSIESIEQKTLKNIDMTTILQHTLDGGYDIGTIATNELWFEFDSEKDINIYEEEFYKTKINEPQKGDLNENKNYR